MVFRAVENRVVVLRAATSGISCFIGPNGDIAERIRDSNGKIIFVSGTLFRNVPLHNAKTIYTLLGNDLNLKWIFSAKRQGAFIVFRIKRLFYLSRIYFL